MGKLTTIFKDTAIYGLSSIVGRFLNYLLVPLYTATLSAASGGYGVITNIYAYVALALVLLTFGMETTYFRFTNKTHTDSETVYGTTLITVGTISLMFAVLVVLLLDPISQLMGYGDHPDYVAVMAITVAIDAFLCIPFAHLRQQRKSIKFAALKLLNIVITILLNLIYFYFMEGKDVGYVFYINMASTVLFGALSDYGVWHLPMEARHEIAAHHAQLFVAHPHSGYSRHSEPDSRQDAVSLHLRGQRYARTTGHLWCLFEDSHDYGNDYAGVPLCLRTHRLRRCQG